MGFNISRLMTPSDLRTCVAGAGILTALACGMVNQGCTAVCSQLKAQSAIVNSKLADAQRVLEDVIASGVRNQLTGSALVEFDRAMMKARTGLQLATEAVALGEKACKDPGPHIAMFVEAWDIIRGFTSLFAGEGIHISDPVLWVEAQ